ncbi:MAG: aminotransferase class V-fold PLP-dependent enzyme [Ignavibacteriae bacterium]|nr:aminotransferase class V-fold PLP-dependent enzyme [Ignavibacteriota bacterium]
MKLPVYLDYNSTTPVDPDVLKAMLPYFSEKFGNAASKSHRYGWEAEEAVEFARKRIAGLINADAKEIIFTSCATESINLALKGIAERFDDKKNHIITSNIEHKAVLDTLKYIERFEIDITYIKADGNGFINPEDVKKAITPYTALVTIMTANNEIGTIQPIAELTGICREKGILFHTDATQAVGKIPIDVDALGIDLMSFSAHKLYGPKGIGALYIKTKKPKIKINEQLNGGGHEKGLRSGTLNVPAIVGFGRACELCKKKIFDEYQSQVVMRDRLIYNFLNNLEFTTLNGDISKRLPNNVNMCFENVDSTVLMSELKELAFSTGSACSSASLELSHVLKAIGRTDNESRCSVRFGIGRFTANEEIEFAIEKIINAVKKIRNKHN